MTDTQILDWLEKWHTLHYSVEALYVVDGYEAELRWNDNISRRCKGNTLREAYINLIKECGEGVE